MTDEQAFYEDANGNVVTRSRAVMGGTVYSVANITSVRAESKPSLAPLAIAMLVGAIAMFFAGAWFLGILLLIFCPIPYLRMPRTMYYAVVGTSAREQSALQSQDPQIVRDIVAALNKAIAAH